MRKSIAAVVSVIATFAFVLTAQTQSAKAQTAQVGQNSAGSIGLLAGIAILSNGGGTVFTYGLDGNWALSQNFQMGIQFNSMNPASTSVGSTTYTSTLTNVDVKLEWVPSGTWDGLKLGILGGYGFFTTNVPGASGTNNLIYGLTGSYDYAFGTRWSLGPQVDVIWNTAANSYTDVNLLAAARYWF